MVYDYIIEHYHQAEPIFFADITIETISKSAINQQLKKLCNEGKLIKYENGVYYMPKNSKLNTSVGINADMVARYKYIARQGRILGFYSGNSFANQLGISNQVPNKVEIVSNNIAAKYREVEIGQRIFIVRKSNVPIDEKNVHVLQLLDLLKNLDAYLDDSYEVAREKIREYIQKYHIARTDMDQYIREFPVMVFKYYYELRLDDVFAH